MLQAPGPMLLKSFEAMWLEDVRVEELVDLDKEVVDNTCRHTHTHTHAHTHILVYICIYYTRIYNWDIDIGIT